MLTWRLQAKIIDVSTQRLMCQLDAVRTQKRVRYDC